MNNLPSNLDEAYEVFIPVDEEDTPPDCHRHCTHFESDGKCCECGETQPIDFTAFIQKVDKESTFEDTEARLIQLTS